VTSGEDEAGEDGAPPPGPVEALRRIAYLLERQGAESYKVRAFRKAAAAVGARDPDELVGRSTAQLQRIPDVGKTTAQVVAEAARGRVPEYLARLEEADPPWATGDGDGGDPAGPDGLDPAARTLRTALQGDCHSHSDWSDGGSPIAEMAEAARALGHRYWTLTDHSPRLTVAHGLDAGRLRQQLEVVAALNDLLRPFRVLTGIEVDILEDGGLDQDEGLLAELDVVVASVHSKLRMDGAAMTRRMLRAVASPHVDILGHCTGRILAGRGRPPSSFDAGAVFAACADSGTAVEVNSRPERLDPPGPLLEAALEAGCAVAIDTDAHAPGQLEWQAFGCRAAARAGVPVERVVNARPVEDLLAWTAGHAR
jgi:putative hydrolase